MFSSLTSRRFFRYSAIDNNSSSSSSSAAAATTTTSTSVVATSAVTASALSLDAEDTVMCFCSSSSGRCPVFTSSMSMPLLLRSS
ncbi:hypothetical protein TKK_0011711 [Trichogramma kaykai]|uniref:Uncharacterized protein n=1 Tax=Trichogramma kaykai TaxID=54128 RepID=A0ABD2WQ62_9HYME